MKPVYLYRAIGFAFLLAMAMLVFIFVLDNSGDKARQKKALTNKVYWEDDYPDTRLSVTDNATPTLTSQPTKPVNNALKNEPVTQQKSLSKQENPPPTTQKAIKTNTSVGKQSTSPVSWEVQVGVFKQAANAKNLRNKIKESLQVPSYIKILTRPDGVRWHLLILGPWKEKNQALRIKKAVDFEHQIKSIVYAIKRRS